MIKSKIKYSEAINRLEHIVGELEENQYDVDILSDRVKEAMELIEYCKAKLKNTDSQLDKILQQK